MEEAKAYYEKLISQIDDLKPIFEYERSDSINFSDDAEQLRTHYEILSGWNDVSIQNAWDRYSTAVMHSTSMDIGYHEEFIGYLVYLTTLSDPDSLHPEETIWIDDVREGFKYFNQVQGGAGA